MIQLFNDELQMVDEGRQMLQLLCLTGLNQGKKYSIDKEEIILGRSMNSDICILDSKTSRRHCSIYNGTGITFVVDHESQNGTFVNNLRVAGEIELTGGDALKVGNTTFKIYDDESDENLEALHKKLQSSIHYSEQELQSKTLAMTNTLTLPKHVK